MSPSRAALKAPPTDAPARGRDRVAAGRWALWGVLALWLATVATSGNKVVAEAWPDVVLGAHSVLGSNGHWGAVYATHPSIQMGPLTFLLAVPFVILGHGSRAGEPAAVGVLTAAGLVLLIAITHLADRQRCGGGPGPGSGSGSGDRLPVPTVTVFIGGVLLLDSWVDLGTRSAHLDDVLAFTFTVAALATRLRRHTVATALLLAAAADAKPWAVAFVPLLVDLEVPVRRMVAAVAVWVAAVAAAWTPFLLADPASVAAGHFRFGVDPTSALRVLGVTDPVTPGWDRPVQALLGAALALAVVLIRRPAAVPLVGLAARLALDPGTHEYYAAGLLVATLLVDLFIGRTVIPWFTVSAFTFVAAVPYAFSVTGFTGPTGDWVSAALRLVCCVSLVLAAFLVRSDPEDPVAVIRSQA
jgi:hypothetical protein